MFRRELDFEVVGKRKREQPNMTCRRQVGEDIDKITLKKEDATDGTKWGKALYELSGNVR